VRKSSNPSTDNTIDRNRALRVGLTVLLYAVILALSLNRDFYNDAMVSAFLSLALASAWIVLGMIRRSWLDLLWVLAGGLSLAVLDFRVMAFNPIFMAGFSFVGIAALAVLGTHTIWADGDERKRCLYGFMPDVIFVCYE
jgi:hypothetical protein